MTSVLDLTLAIAMILDVPESTNTNRWIYGFHFNELIDAVKVFRNYYDERKALYGIPQSMIDELNGYIAKFPTLSFHYTFRATIQNNLVDALKVLGDLATYAPLPVNVGYMKGLKVHWLWPNGTIKQTWDFYANQKAQVPHWISGTDYSEGNVRIEQIWHAMANRSIRFDLRLFKKWSKVYTAWIQGTCISTPLIQDYSLYQYLKMPSEDVSAWCKVMDCTSGVEYNAVPVPITVTDITPPPPLTASIEGTIKGYFPNRLPAEQPLEGATISVGTLSTQTNSSGYYKISNIPVGYAIWAAEKAGWRTIKVGSEYRSGDVLHSDAVMVPV